MELNLKARAKINLSLEIIGKREDGYHDLSMIMQSIDIYDTIKLKLNHTKDIKLITNKSFGQAKDNIAFKAAKLFLSHTSSSLGCEIDLHKAIPSEAGLGGGSADAAAVLLGLNHLTGNPLSEKELISLGTQLGADVSFCLFGGTMYAQGTGNILQTLPFLELDLLLVKPDESVPTKALFSILDKGDFSSGEDSKKLADLITNRELTNIRDHMVNKMYKKSLKFAPAMEKIISDLEDKFSCEKALMSGAGSAVFGVFSDKESLEKAYDYFCTKYPYVYKTKTCDKSVAFVRSK